MLPEAWQKKLETLKQKVQHEEDFLALARYFMEEFGDKSEFIRLCEVKKSKMVEALAIQALKQLPGRAQSKPRLEHLLLLQPKGSRFIHGGFFLEGQVGLIIYFEDIKRGLLVFPPDYVRLTAFIVGTGPIYN
jgi:hypothetical protein